MSELDDFRPRIINWALCMRDRQSRAQSPLAIVLHSLQMQAAKGGRIPPCEGSGPRLDVEDAAFVDHCALRLRRDQLRVLKIAYLSKYTTMDYEQGADVRRSESFKAHRAGLRNARTWRRILDESETALMRIVQSAEAKKNA